MSYFANVRESLAESRRRGLSFEQAWLRAMRTIPRRAESQTDAITPETLKFARKAFCNGYYRRDVLGSASIIAEGDGWIGDHRVDGHASAHALVIA